MPYLNIVTTKATKDGYIKNIKGEKEKYYSKNKFYKMQEVFYDKTDYFKMFNDIRYNFIGDNGAHYNVSKHSIDLNEFEIISQDYLPYDDWCLRNKDIIK